MGRRLRSLADWLRAEHRVLLHPCGVISFPKSGRTWLRLMLDELGVQAEYRHAGADGAGRLVEEIDRREGRRHRRCLILVRDPRDVVVSYFHACNRRQGIHARMRHLYPTELGAFLRDERFGLEKIARYNLLWAEEAASAAHMRILSYESLHADTTRAVVDVTRFFGRPADPESAGRVVEEARFDLMRQREASGELGERFGLRLTPGDPNDPDSFKVRKGKVGSYREEMAPDDAAFADELLDRIGYADRLSGCLEAASVGEAREATARAAMPRPPTAERRTEARGTRTGS